MYILWPICYRSMEMPEAVDKNRKQKHNRDMFNHWYAQY